uniref:Reverse transcriptase Ty1/copia-type domain-containing protein n=1 Tax=Lactuca sativa TaxID=4236 RepID=A0A9R1VST9_LACSA|nr:hypothetical protein LSAT_V11C400209620 [Lactuca sativa]
MSLNEPSWVEAMHDELNQFEKLMVWKLVELPKGKKSLDTRWVFRNKQDDSGVIVHNKAILVVRGFRQVEGLDYTKVYAPVARLEAIRIFLAYGSYMNFTVYQMDVKTAFLHTHNVYDDDDFYDDVEFLKEIDFTGINDDIPTNIEFDLCDENFDSRRVNKVDEVVSSVTKTRDKGNVLNILLSTSKPLEVASSQGDVTSEIPPSVSFISTSAPVIPVSTQPQTSQTSTKSSQSFASLEVPVVRSAPQFLSTITATTVHSPSKQTDEGPRTMFETGGSSSILEYSPTRPSLDEASIRLVKHLAQSSPTSSRGKGISFKEGRTGDWDSLSRDAFGEKFKALFQQPHGIADPPTVQSPSATDDLPVNPPAPRSTTIVNMFEKEPEGSRARITIKQGKRIVTANQSEGLLFMKISNGNRKAKDPVLTVTDLKKRKFGDEYGDRSGIRMWAFDPETNLWVVK